MDGCSFAAVDGALVVEHRGSSVEERLRSRLGRSQVLHSGALRRANRTSGPRMGRPCTGLRLRIDKTVYSFRRGEMCAS